MDLRKKIIVDESNLKKQKDNNYQLMLDYFDEIFLIYLDEFVKNVYINKFFTILGKFWILKR